MEASTDADKWRIKLTRFLKRLGIIVLDPTKPCFENQVHESKKDREWVKELRAAEEFAQLSRYMREIVRKDLRMIDAADFVIFNIEPDKPTWGTVHELVVALLGRKPVLILVPERKRLPLWLFGLVDLGTVFESEKDLKEMLAAINSHEGYLDPKRWKLFAKDYR